MSKYQIKVTDVTDATTRNPAFTARISTDAGQTFAPVQGKFSSWENATNAAKGCLAMTANNDIGPKGMVFLALSFLIPLFVLYFNKDWFENFGYVGIIVMSFISFLGAFFINLSYGYKKDAEDRYKIRQETTVL